MRIIRMTLSQFFKRFIAASFAVLGFAGCARNPFEPMIMYGTPYVEYAVEGKVSDDQGKAVSSATIITRNMNDGNPYSKWSTRESFTDEKGNFKVPLNSMEPQIRIRVIAKAQGYQADSTEVTLVSDGKRDKKNAWKTGEGKEKIDFKLKKD